MLSVTNRKATTKVLSGLACGTVVLLAGCSSTVAITSHPSGAQVTIDRRYVGTTPLKTAVKYTTGAHNTIVLRHPECIPFNTVLRRTPNAASIIMGCLLGPGGVMTIGQGAAQPVPNQHFVLARRAKPGEDRTVEVVRTCVRREVVLNTRLARRTRSARR